jgi:transcriptional regulator with XRE-family HTH domain
MIHISWYSVKGQERLAADAGISPGTVSRLINGLSSPTFRVVWAITKALEKRLGQRLDPCEIISVDGGYPTPSICKLCGCAGCLPEQSRDENNRIRPEYRNVKAGKWISSRPLRTIDEGA